ncbi:MAG: 3-oxoacyl-ACP synthase III family protein [Terriglobia bacterium]
MEIRHCRIAGMGAYLPERVVTNDELGKFLGVTNDWIVERCGIRERRFAAQGEGTAALAVKAIRSAVEDAGWNLADVDFIIFATLSPDHFFPGSGCYAQAMLGLPNIPVMDVRNQCSGFVYSLVVANALIASAQYQRVVVVGAEVHSHCLEVPETNNEVAVLFGDGAAAVALEVSDTPTILASELHVDGSGADALKMEVFDNSRRPFLTVEDIQNRRHIPVMDGIRVFRRAVTEMTATAKALLAKAGKRLEDLDLAIAHQANLRIVEMVRLRRGLSPEKMFNNIQVRGNTTAASIPLAMVEARDAGRLTRGNLLLLVTFGSGFTWGGAVLRY